MPVLEDTIIPSYDMNSFLNTTTQGYNEVFTQSWSQKRHRYRVGETIPNWKQLISQRSEATGRYFFWEQRARGLGQCTFDLDYTYAGGAQSGKVLDTGNFLCSAYPKESYIGPFVDGIFDVSVEAIAKLNVDFLNKVKSVRSVFDGSTFISEFRSTLEGLHNPAKALRRGMTDYLTDCNKLANRLKRAKPIAKNKALADLYLEYKFGWDPLVRDITDFGKAMNRYSTESVPSTRVYAYAREPWFHEIPADYCYSNHSYSRYLIGYARTYGEFRTKLGGVVSLEVNRPISFNETLGLTPSNWLPAIWNVLPYSFVADYFVNISDCMSAGGTAKDVITALYRSVIHEAIFIAVATPDRSFTDAFASPRFTSYSFSSNAFAYETVTKYFKRLRLNPYEDLWVWPTLSLPKLTQSFNLAALATQMRTVQEAFRR